MKERACKEHYQKNLEEEEEEDQLTLSQCFMNRAKNPSASTSTGTPLTTGATTPTRKRSRPWTKSAAYSSPSMKKASALKARLDRQDRKHPSFLKFLSRSHVTQGFWMGLPAHFCRKYLLNHDHDIQLEGENGVQYVAKFLAARAGLSGGWRRFSDRNNLQEGDALVFELVEQCKFKIYAVRANDLDHPMHERQLESAVEDVNVCQNMDNRVEQTPCLGKNCEEDDQPETDYDLGEEGFIFFENDNEDVNVGQNMDNLVEQTPCLGKNFQNDDQPETDYDLGNEGFIVFENDKEESPREIMKDGSSSKSFVDFKNFSIVVNGCPMDSQFSTSVRFKYYELCSARTSYLHNGFPKNINSKLAVGIILETVSVADDMKACTLHTSQTDFEAWGKTLAGFQHLGMDVSFLQERLREMSMLAIEFQECNKAKRHSEVINEENDLNSEIESLEKRLMELKESVTKLHVEREALDAHFQICNWTFQKIAKSPW